MIAYLGAVPRYYYSKNPIFGLTPQCNGSETSLFQCMQQPCHKGRYNAAGVNCSGKSLHCNV